MANLEINIDNFRIEAFEVNKDKNDNFYLNFNIGLYDPNNNLITTVNFSNNGIFGHKVKVNKEINLKCRNLLVALDEFVNKTFFSSKGGTGASLAKHLIDNSNIL